jgi:hypothetical protein
MRDFSPTSLAVMTLEAVRKASDVLDTLPDSETTRRLREDCDECERVVKTWSTVPPPINERERVVLKLVDLHGTLSQLRPRWGSLPVE